jgi:thioester reductase-like protein
MHESNQDPATHPKHTQPSIGKILANGEMYIVDKYMQPVAPGVAGELLIGGVCVSPGYLNREDLTNEKFIDNPFSSKPHSRLYRTGDLVSWMPDGNLTFIGRRDNQVKIRGYRIELGAIENVISQYPDVREVAVIAKESQNGEKSIIAYISPNLDRERFLFQERCLLSSDDSSFYETISEDISRYGIALSGLTSNIPTGKKVKLHIKLPGLNTSKDITARMIWQIDNRCGLIFDVSEQEQEIINKSLDFFISSHNIMDLVLSASAKRSIRRALKSKLPEYMVPTSFVTLLEFPLTFSGKVDVKALPPPDEYEQILKKQFIAPQSETEKQITNIWSSILDRDHISMEDNFFDIGGNSIKAAELSVNIMHDFNISIPANVLFDLPYIPILAQYIDSKGSSYNSQTAIQDDIERDKILPENIEPSGKLSTKLSNPENVLLTGAGGFLGIFLLSELLTTTNAKIHCLVRKGEFESAARRLDATIKKFKLSDRISLSNRRIIAIPSDLGLDKFGLPMDQYKNMAEKVDIIYHCGAQVNTMASYNNLRGSNVLGTHEVIKFATHLQDKPIHYISTLSSAYLTDENGAFTEEFPTDTCGNLFGGYAISKWVSERLLTELKDRGMPVTIYRSGYISGDSETGITSLNDSLLMLIKGCVTLGYAPDMNEKITILPVDFVSKAIVKLSLASGDKSAVYHMDHPTGIMWSDLVLWLNEYGYNIKIVPMSEWKKMLHTIKQDNSLYPFLPYYLALPDDYNCPDVRIEKAARALKRVGLFYPEINDDLLNIYLDYLCNEGFLMRPTRKKTTSGT